MEAIAFSYTRKRAIEDGYLRDFTDIAREVGFRLPVAITRNVWRRCIEIPAWEAWQDETGRAWDLLLVLYIAIKMNSHGDRLMFEVCIQNVPGLSENVALKAIVGPGDHGEPVVTVMFPEED